MDRGTKANGKKTKTGSRSRDGKIRERHSLGRGNHKIKKDDW